MPEKEFKLKLSAGGNAPEQVSLLSGHMTELKKSARELQAQFPELANALRLIASPVGGAMFIATQAFIKGKEAIDEWIKASEAAASEAADPTFAAAIAARADALRKAADEWQTYLDKLHQVPLAADAARDALTAAMNVIARSAEVQGTIGDALFSIDLQRLKNQLDAGLMMVQDYQQRVAELEQANAARKANAEMHAESVKISAAKTAFEAAVGRQPGLEESAQSAAAAAAAIHAKHADDAAALDALEQKVKDAHTKTQAAEATMTERASFEWRAKNDPAGLMTPSAQRAFEEARDAENRLIRNRDQMKRSISAEDDADRAAGKKSARAEEEALANKTLIENLIKQLEELNQLFKINQQNRAASTGLSELQSLLKTQPGGAFEMAAGIQQLLDQHKNVSGSQQHFLQSFEQLLAQMGLPMKEIIELLRATYRTFGDTSREVQQLRRDLDAIKRAQQKQSPTRGLNSGG